MWKALEIEKFTIKFDVDGGQPIEDMVLPKGSLLENLPVAIKDGFEFQGWQLDGSDLEEGYKVVKSITLKAVWKAIEVEKFSVKFMLGEDVLETQMVVKNEKAVQPADPTQENFTFVKWLLDGEAYDFDTPVVKDIVLVAEMSPNEVTVTYFFQGDLNDHSLTFKKKYAYNEPLEFIGKPVSNYIFSHWACEDVPVEYGTPVTKDMIIQAVYEQVEIGVVELVLLDLKVVGVELKTDVVKGETVYYYSAAEKKTYQIIIEDIEVSRKTVPFALKGTQAGLKISFVDEEPTQIAKNDAVFAQDISFVTEYKAHVEITDGPRPIFTGYSPTINYYGTSYQSIITFDTPEMIMPGADPVAVTVTLKNEALAPIIKGGKIPIVDVGKVIGYIYVDLKQ